MVKLLISLAAIGLLASPGYAQSNPQKSRAAPRLFTGQGVTQGKDVYDCTGKYLGSDPDVNIRAQILREGSSECKSGH